MKETVIVSGIRTAVGSFGGGLKNTSVVDLGSIVIKNVLKRINLRPLFSDSIKGDAPENLKNQGITGIEQNAYDWDEESAPIYVDEVIMGNVLQAAQGQNTARQAMIKAGIPKETPAYTVNKVCGSGLKAIALGATSIMTGQTEVIIAGGQENMSMAPMALPKAR